MRQEVCGSKMLLPLLLLLLLLLLFLLLCRGTKCTDAAR
jgi:hypothetical protein